MERGRIGEGRRRARERALAKAEVVMRQVGEFSGWVRLVGSEGQLVCPYLEMSRMRAGGELLLEPHYLGNMWVLVHALRHLIFSSSSSTRRLCTISTHSC